MGLRLAVQELPRSGPDPGVSAYFYLMSQMASLAWLLLRLAPIK
jgi:hypothetical protein